MARPSRGTPAGMLPSPARPQALLALASLAALALAGCLQAPAPEPLEPAGAAGPQDPAPGAVRILVLGDTGTGDEHQHRVAAAALRVCQQRGCDLALVNGDNIYEQGVSSPYDPQFEAKFEEPYAAFDIPFWLVLGNHDNSGGADPGLGTQNQNGDHQVAYARRTDRASDKWNMPARHYTFTVGHVQVWGLDTNPLMLLGDPLHVRDVAGEEQLAWLRGSMDASTAPWRLAFAHHPYVSNGQHGDAGALDDVPPTGQALKRFLEEGVCGRADIFLAGHDHDLQWLKPMEACGRTHFIVSGAGAKTRPLADPERHEAWFQAGDTLGFAWLELREEEVRGAFFDGDAALLFEQTLGRAPR